jgi:hypothetical protein
VFCRNGCRGLFVLAAPLSVTRGGRPVEAAVESCLSVSKGDLAKRWIWAHPSSTIVSPRFAVRSPFPHSSLIFCSRSRPCLVLDRDIVNFAFCRKFCAQCGDVRGPVQGRDLPDVWDAAAHLFPPPSRHEHLHHPMHVWRPLKAEESVGEGQTGERSVGFVPYPLGSCLFLTPMRGLQGSMASPWSMWAPVEEEEERHWCVPARQPSVHSNRGPRTLHPEPAGLRPLAIKWSG